MRNIVRWLAAAAFLAATPASAAWHKASSKHFVIYADDRPASIRAFAEKLERFDAAVRYLRQIDDPALTDSGRVTIFLLPDDDAIMKLAGSYAVRGMYTTRASGSYAFVPRNSGRGLTFEGGGSTGGKTTSLDTEAIFFHEYAHHLQLQEWAGVMPAWVREGFAEFYATAEVDGRGNVTIGRFPSYRSREVFWGGGLSAEELVAADYDKLNGYELIALYGRSWLLTHYLNVSGKRPGQLNRYLAGLEKGLTPANAASAAFGDLKTLSRDVDDYLKPRSFLAFTVDAKVIPIGQVTIQALGPGATAIMDVMMRSKMGVSKKNAPEVAEDARRAAAAFPSDPFVQDALAEAETDAGNYAAAAAAADRSLAVDPNNVRALIYKGRAEMKLAATDRAKADWEKIRGWFLRANRLDTENPEPLMLFYESYNEARQAPTKNAVDGLLYAAELAPMDTELRLKAVRQLLFEKRLEEARTWFAPAAFALHSTKEWQANAQAVVRAIDAGQADTAVALLDKAVAAREEEAKKGR